MKTRSISEFEDIINLPHHVSDHHPQMDRESRAAQFAPFAALSGHGEKVEGQAVPVRDIDDTDIR